MSEKLYKSKFTNEDIKLVQKYVSTRAIRLFVEVWQDGSDDGEVYDINANSLVTALNITSKYYDNINSNKKVVELIMQEKSGEFTCIYHIERNRSGITYEVLREAKR